ncbi:hypothetical protein KY330_00765 [Candidatus Woesearchaeota archaeon]|nr:hypothetical protein [Candidatus Woesearchaeota archaeon]
MNKKGLTWSVIVILIIVLVVGLVVLMMLFGGKGFLSRLASNILGLNVTFGVEPRPAGPLVAQPNVDADFKLVTQAISSVQNMKDYRCRLNLSEWKTIEEGYSLVMTPKNPGIWVALNQDDKIVKQQEYATLQLCSIEARVGSSFHNNWVKKVYPRQPEVPRSETKITVDKDNVFTNTINYDVANLMLYKVLNDRICVLHTAPVALKDYLNNVPVCSSGALEVNLSSFVAEMSDGYGLGFDLYISVHGSHKELESLLNSSRDKFVDGFKDIKTVSGLTKDEISKQPDNKSYVKEKIKSGVISIFHGVVGNYYSGLFNDLRLYDIRIIDKAKVKLPNELVEAFNKGDFAKAEQLYGQLHSKQKFEPNFIAYPLNMDLAKFFESVFAKQSKQTANLNYVDNLGAKHPYKIEITQVSKDSFDFSFYIDNVRKDCHWMWGMRGGTITNDRIRESITLQDFEKMCSY